MLISLPSALASVLRLTLVLVFLAGVAQMTRGQNAQTQTIKLPDPDLDGEVSVEEALRERRSVRDYAADALTLEEVSQLLWAAQGITGADGERTAPSAGALYPMELYLAAGNVDGLSQGLYKYRPTRHELTVIGNEDLRPDLSAAALDQEWVRDGAIVIIITAVYSRTTRKYGDRGRRYVHMEVGHVSQNIYVQASSLGLGTAMVGAFEDDDVAGILGLPRSEAPLAIMPVGRRR